MSELWEDDDYYLRVIGSREKTLTPNQVKGIRALASIEWSVPEITKDVNATNDAQDRNMLAGRTYKRTH